MAKIVKVKISVNITGTPETGYYIKRFYPPEYFISGHRKKIQQLAREADHKVSDIIIRGDNTDHTICVVPDEELATLTASPDIEEITQGQADALGAIWRPQITKINDWNKINEILDKVQNSTALSLADMDAIDPDNEAAGRSRSQSFPNLLTDTMIKVG